MKISDSAEQMLEAFLTNYTKVKVEYLGGEQEGYIIKLNYSADETGFVELSEIVIGYWGDGDDRSIAIKSKELKRVRTLEVVTLDF